MNITNEKYRAMQLEIEELEIVRSQEGKIINDLQNNIKAYQKLFEKIANPVYSSSGVWDFSPGVPLYPATQPMPHRLSVEERAEYRNLQLQERIVHLEKQLSVATELARTALPERDNNLRSRF